MVPFLLHPNLFAFKHVGSLMWKIYYCHNIKKGARSTPEELIWKVPDNIYDVIYTNINNIKTIRSSFKQIEET